MKPAVLIPLSLEASRGDQILNARSFEKSGYSKLLEEENVNDASLLEAINEVYDNRESYIAAMNTTHQTDAINIIVELIDANAKVKKSRKEKKKKLSQSKTETDIENS